MEEADWLACKDPYLMLQFLGPKATDRKLRLLACAIVRNIAFADNGKTIWDLLPGCSWFGTPMLNCHTVLESAERYADDLEGKESWVAATKFGGHQTWVAEADTFDENGENYPDSHFRMALALAVQNAALDYREDSLHLLHIMDYVRFMKWNQGQRMHSKHERRVGDLIREIMGNPFRPASIAPAWLNSNGCKVSRLARSVYRGRDFDRMPRLGDALEEVGCDVPDILDHCRSQGKHARGCWVVDALLGMS